MTEEQRKLVIKQGKLKTIERQTINSDNSIKKSEDERLYHKNRDKLIKQGKLVDGYGRTIKYKQKEKTRFLAIILMIAAITVYIINKYNINVEEWIKNAIEFYKINLGK